jgi:hypothetical protein
MKNFIELNEIRQDNKPFISIENNVIYGTAVKQDYSKNNQDAVYVDLEEGIFCLADGMGGEASVLLYPEEMSKFIVSELIGLNNNKTELHDAVDYINQNPEIIDDEFVLRCITKSNRTQVYLLKEFYNAVRNKTSLLNTYNQRAGATTLLAKKVSDNTYHISKSGDTVFFVVDSNKNIKQLHGISTDYRTTGYLATVDNGEFYLDVPHLDEFTVKLDEGETLVLSTDFIETEDAIKDFIATDFGRTINFEQFQNKHKRDDSTFISIAYA